MAGMNVVFKALSDPTRREVLRLLSHGERTAGELAERFDVTRPSMSHHFAVLKEAELIRSRREGQQIVYSLDTTVMQDVLTRIWDLFGSGPAARPGARDGDHDPAVREP
jgi:DNA-binding transcriptional ArsR family regulator